MFASRVPGVPDHPPVIIFGKTVASVLRPDLSSSRKDEQQLLLHFIFICYSFRDTDFQSKFRGFIIAEFLYFITLYSKQKNMNCITCMFTV